MILECKYKQENMCMMSCDTIQNTEYEREWICCKTCPWQFKSCEKNDIKNIYLNFYKKNKNKKIILNKVSKDYTNVKYIEYLASINILLEQHEKIEINDEDFVESLKFAKMYSFKTNKKQNSKYNRLKTKFGG